MKKYLLPAIIMPLALLLSCGSSKTRQQAEIDKLEKVLIDKAQGTYDKKTANDLITAYQDFTAEFPKDTAAPAYLFKMAELQLHATTPKEAIITLDRIMRDYPDYVKTPECLFLKGYIYENDLHDLNNARQVYQEFVRLYPDHYFADDAKILIQNLGKSPEELVREFEAKNNTSE